MHPGAQEEMAAALARCRKPDATVLDVGSYDVNGTYRPVVERRGWQYTGLDMQAGPNVDIVADAPYKFPLRKASFDVVMSGSTLEHVEAPWLWLPELVRVLRPGGLLAVLTHWSFPEHRYPVDCWRILPDGMRYLFDLTAALRDYQIGIVSKTDIVGSAFKAKEKAVR